MKMVITITWLIVRDTGIIIIKTHVLYHYNSLPIRYMDSHRPLHLYISLLSMHTDFIAPNFYICSVDNCLLKQLQ